MKTFKLSCITLLLFVLYFSSNEWLYSNSSGAVAGRTGAPTTTGGTEATCQNCHGGTINTGPSIPSLSITGDPQFFVAGQVYNLTVSLSGGTGNRGFQIVALDPDKISSGTFTAGQFNKIVSQAGRQYVTHNTSSSQTWSFTWTAPATLPENVSFYISAGTRGPSHTYTFSKIVQNVVISVSETDVLSEVVLFPSHATKEIFVKSGNVSNPLNAWAIVDNLGRTVLRGESSKANFADVLNIQLPTDLKSGAYSVLLSGPKGRTLKRFYKN